MATDTLLLNRRAGAPVEVLEPWLPAQRVVARFAPVRPSIAALRSIGFLAPDRAERIAAWYAGDAPAADRLDVEQAYGALEAELPALGELVGRQLAVRVTVVPSADEPYADAATLCADVRRGAMLLRSAAADVPHPLLSADAYDHLRAVHDVLGHTALGLGFDLQSEYAAWLFCRRLFSPAARPAAFTELVGAVTAFVVTGDKPPLRADLAPAGIA